MNMAADDDVKPQMAGVAWGLVTCAVVGLALRRLAGGFVLPVPASVVLGWSTGVTLWCAVAWSLYRQPRLAAAAGWRLPLRADFSGQHCSTWGQAWPEILSLAVPLLALVSVLPPLAASSVGMATGGLVLVAAVVCLSSGIVTKPGVTRPSTAVVPQLASSALYTEELASDAEASEQTEQPFEEGRSPAPDEQQSMLRRREADCEVVEGWLRVEFAADQRELTCHIPFVPPLVSVPSVELEDLEGCDWDVRLTASYPFGIRVAVRRRQNSPTAGHIGYCATALWTMRQAG